MKNIKSCGCRACRAARKTRSGKREVVALHRAIRRNTRRDLRQGLEPAAVVAAGYAG